MRGECSCYLKYPNELHKRNTGKWICVDEYECVRPIEYKEDGTVKRKTLCRKKVLEHDSNHSSTDNGGSLRLDHGVHDNLAH